MASRFELRNKRVLVVGLGRTGLATALFCSARGAEVVASDLRSAAEIPEVSELGSRGVKVQLGRQEESLLAGQDLVVPSPGVAANAPLLVAARQKNIRVWSEIELAYRFLQGKVIGITGSNGKTTTTSLVEHILRKAGLPTILAGNIGTPLISCVEKSARDSLTVLELSSFQLELVETFRPDIALYLNLTPDHLDRHGSMDSYAAAKARIFENQTAQDAAVLNRDDPASAASVPQKPRVFWFSRKQELEAGVFLRGGEVIFRREGSDEFILYRRSVPLPGAHNLENVLAATAACRLAGVSPEQIASGVESFQGVEHRLEFVAEIQGVRYYNDSKATNVDATLKALDAFCGRILIILGGKDKGSDYRALQKPLGEKAQVALLIGAASERIERQIAGSVGIERVGTLECAVERASRLAQPGDTVLLAPACASFDQFQNYEHRGRVFKQLVHELERQAANATSGK
jgi:UDP-N-acetylmuramoylalanine--D-glutamate ligase